MAFQQDPVGNQGAKEFKGTQTTPSNPGGVVNPPAKGKGDPSSFGWKALDYKFGDRPAYQLLKNKATTGSWCGKGQDNAALAAGMNNPSAAAAAAAAQSGSEFAQSQTNAFPPAEGNPYGEELGGAGASEWSGIGEG